MQAAVRIAYFKLYYPVEYYTAILTRYGAKNNAHYRFFAINPDDNTNIIRPLTSIAGVGEGLATKIYNDISLNGAAGVDELYERTMVTFDEETGKSTTKKIYTDSVLLKLNLPVPEDLTDAEKELAKKYKIAISKFSKVYVRNKIKEYQLNPPYEITEKDKALQKLIKIKVSDFETTKDFKQKLDEEIELICSIDPKIALKVQKINEKYDNSPE